MSAPIDATIERYLAAGLNYHSTSTYRSSIIVIPKKDGGLRITVDYRRGCIASAPPANCPRHGCTKF